MSQREINAKKAVNWLNKITSEDVWKRAIEQSIKETEYVTSCGVTMCFTEGEIPRIPINVEFRDCTTHDVIKSIQFGPIAVLNFASYFKPGGGFLKGSISQEESLCHVSGLYPVLSNLRCYSTRNKRKDIPPEYFDEVIYSPSVPFQVGDMGEDYDIIRYVDVLSCAAPNMNRLGIDEDKVLECLRKRIESIVCIPIYHHVDTLVLGAWGCGVFKNDPAKVAQIFKEVICDYGIVYQKIIFAIPNEGIRKIFEEVFSRE